jgi:tetratricopeptide (TPR) repeat protein/predicted Ser/Thr protein kinase
LRIALMPNDTDFAPPFRAPMDTPEPTLPAVRPQTVPAELPAKSGYEFIAEVGRGGMGVVYKARQCSLKRVVAVKMIMTGLHPDAKARERFRTEAEAVARLQHPNIVQIYEVGEFDGKAFLTLEYIDGGPLTSGVRPDREAASVVETLARAVHYMHLRGILHRDLKPNNVLVASDGTPKITDFGLAKILDADAGTSQSGTLIGTPGYMAPEQAGDNANIVGAPADVYSLGAILYELLTGRAPFEGAGPLCTMMQVRSQDPIRPRQIRRSVSVDLETICLKCLEKEPGRRYSSAEALADDLRRFLEGRPILARPAHLGRRLWKLVRRRPAVAAWGVAAAVLVCLSFTVWSYFRTAGMLAVHQADEKYQQFVQLRDDALLHGLLAADEEALFLGGGADSNLQAADVAAKDALAIAGIDLYSESAARSPNLPASRQREIAADCYVLLLIAATAKAQQTLPDQNKVALLQQTLSTLDRASRLGFETRAYHLQRARLLDLLGQQAKADNERDRASSLAPQTALDHFLAGEEQYRRANWASASNSFNRALSLQPGHFWAQFFLAVCQLKELQWDAAKASLNACLTQNHEFVWAYLFRSFANEKLHASGEAEADFEKAMRLNPNDDARYALYLTRGVLHFNQRELQLAEADFRSAVALKPDRYNGYLNLAHVYLTQGQLQNAEDQLAKGLAMRPPNSAVAGYHLERGRAYLRDKKYEEAIQECDAALGLFPQQPHAQELRGRAMLALGRYQDAEASFDQYLENGGQKTSDLYRGRGLARMKLGKYLDAAEDYSRALELAPDADIYQHRGWAYFFSDAWKLASRDFSKAIELDSDTDDAYTGRGLARVMLGEYRDAVTDAEVAVSRKPATPEMMHNIACVFAQAAPHAKTDVRLKYPQALAESYRRKAVEAVRQTLAMLPPEERQAFWKEKIMPDAALVPLHGDAEFKRLQDEFAPRFHAPRSAATGGQAASSIHENTIIVNSRCWCLSEAIP